MPKIINNLEERIYKSAFTLFVQKGYKKVSMKSVAEETGVAVGTLYNYYANKEELFLSVLKHRIKQIYLILDGLVEQDCKPLEFVTVFYDEFSKLGGFIEEITRSNIGNEISEELGSYIGRVFQNIIAKAAKKRGYN